MSDPQKTRFLERVRASLGKDLRPPDFYSRYPSEPRQKLLEKIKGRSDQERLSLLDRLKQNAAPLNLDVVPVGSREILVENFVERIRATPPEWGTEKRIVAWDHELIHGLDLPAALKDQNVPVYFTGQPRPEAEKVAPEEIRREVSAAYVGVTTADYCIADTATLVTRNRPGQPRSVSLVPSVHVAVIKLNQLIENLTELYALLQPDPDGTARGLTNCMTFISGPSKTGDIELTMVHGAHGPKEVVIYVLTG